MIGGNLSHHIQSAEDARAYAAAIAALRSEVDRLAAPYDQSLAAFKKDTDAIRAERDAATTPLVTRADAFRKVLADWLAGDPDGSLKDGDRVVATLARKFGKLVVEVDKLPPQYVKMAPAADMDLINAALARGESVPGVTRPVEITLRVL